MGEITPVERRNAEIYLATTRARVVDAIKDFSHAEVTFKPDPQRWSIAETVQHLTIVDKLVFGLVSNAAAAATVQESAWKDQDQALLIRVRDRRERLQAPEIGIPFGELSDTAVIAGFERGRDNLLRFIRDTKVPLRKYSVPHPVFGCLDCYQWVLSLGAHAERHLKQIEETIELPEFPRSSAN
jgi:hypothetical protein